MYSSIKSIVVIFILTIFLGTINAETIQITVSGEGTKNSFKLSKSLKVKAQKDAIKKYVTRLNKNVDADKLRQLANEYGKFVEDVMEEESKWQPLTGDDHGQLVKSYSVDIDNEKLGQELEKLGFNTQGDTELVILEEPPSIGQQMLDPVQKLYRKNYTEFQRSIRDVIVKKLGECGFKTNLLADKDEYNEYKAKDTSLLGVFYDPKAGKFQIHKDLLDAIKANNPDTVVLYYRIAALVYDKENKQLKAAISISMKRINDNTTKSIGKQRYSVALNTVNNDAVIDAFSQCAENSVALLMNDEGKQKMNDIIMAINNTPTEKGPLKLSINLKVFDKKFRKRFGYMLKKELLKQKLVDKGNITLRNNNLSATLNENSSPEDFFYEKLMPVLEGMMDEDALPTDDKISFNGNKILIQP